MSHRLDCLTDQHPERGHCGLGWVPLEDVVGPEAVLVSMRIWGCLSNRLKIHVNSDNWIRRSELGEKPRLETHTWEP